MHSNQKQMLDIANIVLCKYSIANIVFVQNARLWI